MVYYTECAKSLIYHEYRFGNHGVSAPPYHSQHQVLPARWSYIGRGSGKHYATFSVPPPYQPIHVSFTVILQLDCRSNTCRSDSNLQVKLVGR
jgi:hypothetical protein